MPQKETSFLLHRSFVKEYSTLAQELHSSAEIFNYFDPSFSIKTEKALWDTGANRTAVNIFLIEKLKLNPVSKVTVQGAHGPQDVDTYMINLQLGGLNQVLYHEIEVSGLGLGDDTDVLIGMDIITLGDFAISNAHGKTTFSYAVPPFENKVNLADRAEKINIQIQKKNSKS